MKNKEKFKKICNIISKVLLIILVALLIFTFSVALFKACNKASASEADGIGTWVWNEDIPYSESLYNATYYAFSFVSNGVAYSKLVFAPDGNLYYEPPEEDAVYVSGDVWRDNSFRTIVINSPPPAEFMTILRNNATYQNLTPVETYTVTKNVSNGTMPGGADTIQTNGTATYQIAPNNGYTFPQTISVLNAEYTYDNTTGSITISNPTGNVVIYVNCVRSDPTGVDLIGYFRFKDVLIVPAENFNQTMRFEPLFNDGVSYFTELQLIVSNGNLTMRFLDPNLNWIIVYETSQGWIRSEYQAINIGSPVAVSGDFNNWFTENTVALENDASGAYNQGYTDGFNAGNTSGYNKGYNAGLTAGQSTGYNEGYNKGYTDGQQILGGTEGLIAGTSNLFTMKIFGTFSILDILLIVFGIGMGIWFLKMFAGG